VRIAQVAPLYEAVPPLYYGGTERVVSYLTEELVRQGHDVTLFASGDSVTSAKLSSCCRSSLRLDPSCVDPLPHHLLMLEQVYRRAEEFDILHFHTDYLHFPLCRRHSCCQLTTLHGRLDIADLAPLYQEFTDIPLVSISDAQRTPLPWANWKKTVHHGLPPELLPFNSEGGDYLAFLGRISPEKRVDTAIAIARRSGIRVRIAAKVDKVDLRYFNEVIKPLLDGPLVEFIGEIGEDAKKEFLGNAMALLFPIDWEEPFGLVMIEAMACGTPVIAYARASVPEVIRDGVSGFIVRDVDEAVRAVAEVGRLSRAGCRRHFEESFTAQRMAADYLALYHQLMAEAGRMKTPEE
jgi:glycosyltransferase involved in cell wall biosynthesis